MSEFYLSAHHAAGGDLDERRVLYWAAWHAGAAAHTRCRRANIRWSFIGYGDEASHTVLELTYNWGVDKYDIGTAFGHLALGVPDVYATCERCARQAQKSPASRGR